MEPETQSSTPDLATLLNHSLLWRAQGVRTVEAVPTGHSALDERLPGGGMPTHGLVEILTDHYGIGEISLLLPLFLRLLEDSLWMVWVAPPFEAYAAALRERGMDVNRILIVRTNTSTKTKETLWALEQTLRSSACRVVLGWLGKASMKSLRRLQLAAEQTRTLSVLFRPLQVRHQSSPAVLRLMLNTDAQYLEVEILKSRGGFGGSALFSHSIQSQVDT